MRDSASWRRELVTDLRDAGFPHDKTIPAAAFCQVELGLYLMCKYHSGQPVGTLQPLLSKYLQVADSGPGDSGPGDSGHTALRGDGGLGAAVMRHARHRMGDTARRGHWRSLLNAYLRVPAHWRAFETTDATDSRVSDQTVFRSQPVSRLPGRLAVYEAALRDDLTYMPSPSGRPAPPSKRYRYTTEAGAVEYVTLPPVLPSGPPVSTLEPRKTRERRPWVISFENDLRPTAEWMDKQLANRPDITNTGFSERLSRLRFKAVDASSPTLVDNPPSFTLNGLDHIVGLMNSLKTTLGDITTVDCVNNRHARVCLVVGSVGDVLAKVSFFRALGIRAVPLIGHSSHGVHAERYWRTAVEESDTLIPGPANPPDLAAAYVNTSCLLEPFRTSTPSGWAPLAPEDFPCQGRLHDLDDPKSPRYDCPLLQVCPVQKARREIADAQVWVTTAQCLVATRAQPSTISARWLEMVQHQVDLMIIDEADAVQQVLDHRFVQQERLVGTVEPGWTHRMVGHTNDALAHGMAHVVDPNVDSWNTNLKIHERAVYALNRLALTDQTQQLTKLLDGAPFTSHSMFRWVARTLYGLPPRGDGPKDIEDQADDFYRATLQEFAERPLRSPTHSLRGVVDLLTSEERDEAALTAALDSWIDDHVPTHVKTASVRPDAASLRLVIEIAIWAGRITTTFFEMATIYPSVKDKLRLPDEETFWLDQPPRDYRALVPEAPMGNILALQWKPHGEGASLQLLWVHGVGRWLLHHAHDLLSCEGVDGPHVVLMSATSWIPGSSFYHIPVTPTAVLGQNDADRAALLQSTLTVEAAAAAGQPIFVSGRHGIARDDALRQMVTALCDPTDGRSRSVVHELRAQLPPGRQQILFVVLSGRDAELVSEHINRHTAFNARHVVPDAGEAGRDGILRRRVSGFGTTSSAILVAAELSIQRGYNILNAQNTAALGAVIYMNRSHPPPFDLAFPLSLVSQLAIEHLNNPPAVGVSGVEDEVRRLRKRARRLWFDAIGRPMVFRNIPEEYRAAFVANNLVPMSQTIGRSIRGNQPTIVRLADAAFAERLATADTTGDTAADTVRTSIVVTTDHLLQHLLAGPGPNATEDQHRTAAINDAVWGLMGHLIMTSDPLGSHRKAAQP